MTAASGPRRGCGGRPATGSGGAQHIHGGVVKMLAHLAPEELGGGRLRAVVAAVGNTRQHAPVLKLEQADLDEGPGQGLSDQGVFVSAGLSGQAEQLLKELEVDDELAGIGAPLHVEGGLRHPPAVAGLADDLVVSYEHVVEEDLVEVGLVGDLSQGADVDPVGVHVDHEGGDAPVLGSIGVGAGQAQAPVGELGVGGPHLLAAEPPAAVGGGGPGGEGGQVAAGVGLAEQLAEQLFGGEDRREPALFLLVGAVGQDGGADQVNADAADQLRGSGPGQLFLDDVVVHWAGASAAVGDWPGDADEAGFGEGRLPLAEVGDLFGQVVEQGRQALAVFPGKILLEPMAAFVSERLLVWCGG